MTARVVLLHPDELPGVVDKIMEIETSSFSVPWKADDFRISAERGTVAASFGEDDSLLGYGCSFSVEDEAEITNLAVAAGERRRGIGGGLLDRLIGNAERSGVKRIYLEVRESNDAAIALYSSRGFYKIGCRRGYYRLPKEDAVLMMKEINP